MKLQYRVKKSKYEVASQFRVDVSKVFFDENGENVSLDFEWYGEPRRITDDDGMVALDVAGILTISAGEGWDGASGPTRDSKKSKRASLTHDMLYRLMRQGHLPKLCRRAADELFYDMLREDGMSQFRAWIWWRAVSKFAAPFADRDHVSEVYST